MVTVLISRERRRELLCGCGRDPLLRFTVTLVFRLRRKAGKSGTIQGLARGMKVDGKDCGEYDVLSKGIQQTRQASQTASRKSDTKEGGEKSAVIRPKKSRVGGPFISARSLKQGVRERDRQTGLCARLLARRPVLPSANVFFLSRGFIGVRGR